MTPSPPATPRSVRRGRRMFIALCVLFFGTMLVAGGMRFSGWRPAATSQYGELLSPPSDLRGVTPVLADGQPYRWQPSERLWRIAIAPTGECGASCLALANDLDKVWRLFGHNADRVQVLWIGVRPDGLPAWPELRIVRADPALRQGLPRVDDPAGIPVYVIDPNGFVILRYAPGSDPVGLRSDLSKLLKLK